MTNSGNVNHSRFGEVLVFVILSVALLLSGVRWWRKIIQAPRFHHS